MGWAPRRKITVPPISSPSNVIEINDYSRGMNSFIGNDLMPLKSGDANYWRLAQDARINTFGEYGTRKGFDNYTSTLQPQGSDLIVQRTASTGNADQNIGGTNWIAQPFTTVGAVRMTSSLFMLKNTTGATGTIIVELWSNSGGVPRTRLSRSSISSTIITSTYVYVPAFFADAPLLSAATTYFYVLYIQSGGNGLNYNWRSSTATTDALTSTNSGASYSSNSFGMNFYNRKGDDDPTIGLHQAIKSDGTTKVLMASGTEVAYVDETTSDPTGIKTGLNAGAAAYRFVTVNDIVYYVNGFDGYRKWDFTTESQVNSTPYTNICSHKGFIFLVDKSEPNKLVYSNFGIYETFTSTDFILVPAPKTGDPITALVSLNGYLLIFTRKSKYILSGSDNSTFQLSEAPDQKGTFTQETTTTDQNFVYYLSDDGVYRSNGNEAQIISTNIYQDILDITTKETVCMAVNRGRLYLWYSSPGSSANDTCFVWSLNYDSKSQTVESKDTQAYVSRAITGLDTDYPLIVGSSLVGTVYYQELPSNDYNNLGGDINFYLQTHYMTLGSPAVLHEVRRWLTRVSAQSSSYALTPQYAYDLRDNFQSIGDINVQGSGPVWGSGIIWGAFTWGTTAEVQAANVIPGEYRRIALAYSHSGARQPNSFLGHTIVSQSRRIR